MGTQDAEYTRRLLGRATWWKRVLDVQRPYRTHLRRLRLGRVLDVGCGIGRNLINLGDAGLSVGVDHNAHSVEAARSRGLTAFTPDEFRVSPHATGSGFDSLLFSHVAEHLRFDEAAAVLKEYLPRLRPGGRVVLITPQEAGYRSDPTHVTFVDDRLAAALLEACGLRVARQYSFPFPRSAGRLFPYNEFVAIAEKEA